MVDSNEFHVIQKPLILRISSLKSKRWLNNMQKICDKNYTYQTNRGGKLGHIPNNTIFSEYFTASKQSPPSPSPKKLSSKQGFKSFYQTIDIKT